MNTRNIEIRMLSTMEELAELQQVESMVWKMDSTPLHQTYTALLNGGILLGAYDGKKMVGFLYSFAGFTDGSVYLCSHMLGILTDYRMEGLGERMKLKQAELARDAGYSMITWTFDPLESQNAYLNLHKLGATGAIYDEDHYGEMNDGLNQGLPSDRFQVKWHLNEERPKQTYSFDKEKLLLEVDSAGNPLAIEDKVDLNRGNVFFVAIPMNFQEIKQINFELAKRWRMETRYVFQSLFQAGFQATDLLLDEQSSLSYYVFTR